MTPELRDKILDGASSYLPVGFRGVKPVPFPSVALCSMSARLRHGEARAPDAIPESEPERIVPLRHLVRGGTYRVNLTPQPPA